MLTNESEPTIKAERWGVAIILMSLEFETFNIVLISSENGNSEGSDSTHLAFMLQCFAIAEPFSDEIAYKFKRQRMSRQIICRIWTNFPFFKQN